MKPQTHSSYVDVARRVIGHIVAHLDDALDLDALAREACLSPFHFHRVFRGMVGETPLELIRRLRLERAASRLVRSDDRVTDIAFGAGFETHEAFTRAFRTAYAKSPSAFRQMRHARIELSASDGIHYDPLGSAPTFVPRDSGGKTMHVEILEKPALRVASIRHIGPYMQINQAFEQLGQIAGRAGLLGAERAPMIAVYHDDPESTPPNELRSDAGVIVSEDASLPEPLTEQRLAPGSYACMVHVGPYERLGDVWQRLLGEWIPAHGHRVTGVSYERYLNMPGEVAADELRTEICVPIG